MADTPTPPASDPASPSPTPGESGSGSTGTGSGTDDAGALASQLEQAQTRARQEQGRADRLAAELAQLKAPPAPKPDADSSADAPLTAADVQRAVAEAMARQTSLAASVTALRSDESLKYADQSIFDRFHEFDSPEALRAAAEQSHRSFESRLQALEVVPKSDVDAQLQAYRDRYGELSVTPRDTGGATSTGDPTLEEIAGMTFAQRDELEAANPGVIARVIRSAEQKELQP